MTFSEWLKAKGVEETTTPEGTLTLLRAAYKADQTPAPAPPPTSPPANSPTVEAVIEAQRADNNRIQAITDAVAKAAKASPSRLDEIKAIGDQAVRDRWDLTQTETRLLIASVPNAAPLVYSVSRGDVSASVVEAAVARASGLQGIDKAYEPRVLEAADKHFSGAIGLHEVIGLCASQHGFRGTVNSRNYGEALELAYRHDLRASAGPSSYSISGILGNVLRKSVRENFNFVEQEWPKIAVITPVKDFKEIASYSLTGGVRYERIAPGGEIKSAKLGETSYSNQADSYGAILAIDRRDMINDDMGALGGIGKKLGRAAGLKVNEVVWGVLTANVDPDGNTFFSTGNGNYDEGVDTTFSNDGLVAADLLWSAMTDPDGKIMGHVARKLVVPYALRIPAMRLMSSQSFGSTDEEGTDNPWAGMFDLVASRYLTAAKVWYLLADPNDVPVLEVCFLNGNREPVVETVDMAADRLGMVVRSYHDFGAALQETRGGYKFKGEV